MNERDIRAQRAYAVREGRKEGFEKGHAEGVAQGMAQGMAEGKAEVAKAMLEGGVPMDQITRFTGLTEGQIKAL